VKEKDRKEKNPKDLKALVLCAGKGTRLRPLTDSVPKPLIPVANRPILFYILNQIKSTGISEVGIVASPDNVSLIKEATGDGSRWDLHITYIIQEEAKGLAHAVITSETFLGNSSFLMFLGDNLIKDNLNQFINAFCFNNYDAFILLKEVPDPRLFGVAELDEGGRIIRVVEKPQNPRSKLVLIGVYLFSPEIHNATHSIKPSWRGELEITDAIQWLMDRGKKVYSYSISGWWLDTGKKEDLLKANQIMLDEFTGKEIKGNIDIESSISGKVEIGEGTIIKNSRVYGPVAIASECIILNSEIGSFTSIGSGCHIKNTNIMNSIILDKCELSNVKMVKNSVMGANVQIADLSERAMELFLGSYSQIYVPDSGPS